MPPHAVVEDATAHRKPPEVRSGTWRNPSRVGTMPPCHFHATLARMLGATLIRHAMVPGGAPRQNRLWVAPGRMEALPGAQWPGEGVMGLLQAGARPGPLRVCAPHIPPRLLLLASAPAALPMSRPRRVGDVVGKGPSLLAACKHAPACALSRPVQ
jgi:hypothetical protein